MVMTRPPPSSPSFLQLRAAGLFTETLETWPPRATPIHVPVANSKELKRTIQISTAFYTI